MSGGEDAAQEKSHDATERKIGQAREKGDLAQSQDAQAALAYVGLALTFALAGDAIANGAGEVLSTLLDRPDALAARALSGGGAAFVAELGGRLAPFVLPLLLVPGLVVLAALVAFRRIVFAPGKIAPKLSRLSPVENAKQKFGPHGLVEFAKSSVKLAAVGVILWLALAGEADRIAGYVRVEARLAGRLLEDQFWTVMAGVVGVVLAIAGIDTLWQRRRHLSQLRMTHEELKEEAKETEGDPWMKASRRERARGIATNRMLLDVPKADVVITNPTHYAVALAWDRTPGSAPRCVAKGVDEVAAAIRLRAAEAGVPLRADPPTARALHAIVEIGAEIPPDQFRAVAAAIVFADDLRRRRRGVDAGGWS